jgi:hypothetical protein
MVVDPDDALFIENERCVQFASVLDSGGQDTNWHLVAAWRADKLRPPRPRVEHGDALDRIMQACTERRKIIAEELAEVADARRRCGCGATTPRWTWLIKVTRSVAPLSGLSGSGREMVVSLHHSRAWTIACLGERRWSGMKQRTTR